MDMYHALTYYHLVNCILHKIIVNTNESVLFVTNLTVDYQNIKKKLEKENIFKKVFIFDEKKTRALHRKYDLSKENEIMRYVKEHNSEVKENMPVNIEGCDNLFICADHFSVGIYINANKLKYSFFEDGSGQQSRRETTVDHSIKLLEPNIYHIVKAWGLCGENDNVKTQYVDMESQINGWHSEKAVDFPVGKLLKKLTKKQIDMFKRIFDIKSEDINCENKVIFLPQHNVNLNVFTIDAQLRQSSLLVDYFAENERLVIKPPPNDDFTDYSKVFYDAEIIDRKFPAELMFFITDGKFAKGITAWSTSINSLGNMFHEKIIFSADIDKKFIDIHRYYLTGRILRDINTVNIYCMGVDIPLIKQIMKIHNLTGVNIEVINNPDETKKFGKSYDFSNGVCVIDDLTANRHDCETENFYREFALRFSCAVFINSKDDYFFFSGKNYEIFENLYMFNIKKELMYEPYSGNSINLDDENMWVFMENKENLEKISGIEYIKKLKYSQMITYANVADEKYELPSKNEVYRNIKMLEGILRATESRLLYELKKNETLRIAEVASTAQRAGAVREPPSLAQVINHRFLDNRGE